MSNAMIESLSVTGVQELLQQIGYRVEVVADPGGAPFLRSATSGMPFEARLITRLPGDAEIYGDMVLMTALRIQGDLALDLVNQWNNTRRFGRLRVTQDMLVLEMEVPVFGGVAPAHVRAQVEIWDRLVQELLPFLREVSRAAPAGADAAVAPAAPERVAV
jgi:hypothetical protein